MPSERASLPSRTLMCSWKVSLLSKVVPKYFVLWIIVKIEESLVTLIKKVERFNFGGMIRMLVIEELTVSLLTQHQFWRFLNSSLILFLSLIKFSAFTNRQIIWEHNWQHSWDHLKCRWEKIGDLAMNLRRSTIITKELTTAISKLSTFTASGPDLIAYPLLTHLPLQPATSSLHLQLVLVISHLSLMLETCYHYPHTQTR